MVRNIKDISSQAQSAFNNFGSQAQGALNSLQGPLTGTVANFGSQAQSALNNLQGPLNGAVADFGSNFQAASASLQNSLGDFNSVVSQNVNESLNGIVNQLRTDNQIVTILGQTENILGEKVGIFSDIAQAASGLSGIAGNISDTIGGFTGDIQSKLGSISGTVKTALGSVNQITGIANQAVSNISGLTSQLGFSGLDQAVNSVGSKLTDFNQVLGGGFDKINNSINTISGRVNSVTSKINNVVGTIDTVSGLLSNPEKLGNIVQGKIQTVLDSTLQSALGPINNIINLGSQLANKIQVIGSGLSNIFNSDGSLNALASIASGASGLFDTGLTAGSGLSSGTKFYENIYEKTTASASIPSELATEDGKLRNPLEYYNHYNYIITLGILSANQFNFASSYRSAGGDLNTVICRSSGGDLSKKVLVDAEYSVGGYTEYFIEDLEIDSVIAPNQNTGVALGTSVRFNIIEPYSMGKFIEAIRIGAIEASGNPNANHLNAPFCLEIEFYGWDEYGNTTSNQFVTKKHIPIKIVNMDFDVTDQGSNYSVEAVVYSERALEENVDRIKSTVESDGNRVHQVLETTEGSLTRALNATGEEQEDKGTVIARDRYAIIFPRSKRHFFEYLESGSTATFEESPQEAGQAQFGEGSPALGNTQSIQGASDLYYRVKTYAENESNMNEIGKAPIVLDASEDGDVPMNKSNFVWDPEARLWKSSIPESGTPTTTRSYKFDSPTKITNAIENVIMDSVYIDESIDDADNTTGMRNWFRIETYTLIDDSPQIVQELGRPAYIYVYAVHPYTFDESKIVSPGETPKNTQGLMQQALKSYDYFYTGKNKDIISFDINFNFGAYATVLDDLTQGSTSTAGNRTASKPTTGETTNPKKQGTTESDGSKEIQHVERQLYFNPGGKRLTLTRESKRKVAEMWHNSLINAKHNLISAEMEIWGDPYYIPTDQGNYVAADNGSDLTDEFTMSYMQREVLIVMNFRTPLDYQYNGAVMNFPELVRPFSGIYSVLTVTNKFSQGTFTQELKLLRRHTGDGEGTSVNGPISSASADKLSGDQSARLPFATEAQALSATGSLPGVGYGAGQVDPRLAAATYAQTGQFSSPGTSTQPGQTVGVGLPAMMQTQGLSVQDILPPRPPVNNVDTTDDARSARTQNRVIVDTTDDARAARNRVSTPSLNTRNNAAGNFGNFGSGFA